MKKGIIVCTLILFACILNGWGQSPLGYITSDGVKMRFELLPDGKGLYLAYVDGEGEYDVVIPREVDGFPVKRIGSSAFYNAKG